MSNHKQALKDLIVDFIHNCTSEIKEEKEFELNYGDERLHITIKPRSVWHEHWENGNTLKIQSGNYIMYVEETEMEYLNLPTLCLYKKSVYKKPLAIWILLIS